MADADLILRNVRIRTLDPAKPEAQAVATREGRFLEVGSEADAMRHAGPATRILDGGGRRLIPGLIDSHMHVIRGGLNFALELRWDGVPSLADAMRMLKEQVDRTPRRNGCGSSAASRSISSPRSDCRRWTSSTRSRPTRRSSSCISTTGPCSTARR